jgi:hypothetical protein
MILKCLTSWTREFLLTRNFTFYFLFYFDLCEVFVFCPLCSDNENPKNDAAAAPLVEVTTADETSPLEAAPVVESPKAPVKRVSASRGSKRLKKSTDAGVSLDAHRSLSSSDDVSTDLFAFYCFNFPTHVFLLSDLDEEVCLHGH